MAYSELIKRFENIRSYMRDFYVYGFKSRDEFTAKSLRSYDNEKRRVECWLGEYMKFNRTSDGKQVFISIDSRSTHNNPFFRAFKSKTFTDGDITLHFILFDILNSPNKRLFIPEIMDEIDERLSCFDAPKNFDESTVRKKLKEYSEQGLVIKEKQGRSISYRRSDNMVFENTDVLGFFSEVAPCGVIGSFILDKSDEVNNCFTFKHHYISHALDSEILLSIFDTIDNKHHAAIKLVNNDNFKKILPLAVMISVQNGRQHLAGYSFELEKFMTFRLDHITDVKKLEYEPEFDKYRASFDSVKQHLWGVSIRDKNTLEQVEFVIYIGKHEDYILDRLNREKRCGLIERIDGDHVRFSADVYDARELFPWIRTFIGRITHIEFSNDSLTKQFKDDLREMNTIYGLAGGEKQDDL